eukprot:277674_1
MTQLLFVIFILRFIHVKTSETINTFNIQTDTSGPELIDEFLSVTIDAQLVGQWNLNKFNFSSTLVNTLAKGLSPSYFRFGGSSQDEIVYNTNNNISLLSNDTTKYTLNMSQFSTIAHFAKRNNWKFIFGLNNQQRHANNTWNPLNAQALMNKIIESTTQDLVIGYELGNEPDLYEVDSYFMDISPKQLSKDFAVLYDLIHNKVYKNTTYKPFIWGCDICCHAAYLSEFLQHSNPKIIAGVTWHQYYGNAQHFTLSDFISVQHMDSLMQRITDSLYVVHNSLSNDSFDILGETASTSSGGNTNLSSSFVAGFLWLDKLGISSAYGLHSVTRQAFWGSNYGLIGLNGVKNDFNPNPDYWSSYLFKNLIGNKVLFVDGEFNKGRSIRVYAFCTRTKDKGSIYDYSKGSITTLILNVQNNTVLIDLNIGKTLELNSGYFIMSYDEFLLTSYSNVIQSRDIFLNGELVTMVNDNTFPQLKPVEKTFGSSIVMNALSYGFVVISNANASVCL